MFSLSSCPALPGFLSDISTFLNITNFNVFWFIIPVFHFTKGKSFKWLSKTLHYIPETYFCWNNSFTSMAGSYKNKGFWEWLTQWFDSASQGCIQAMGQAISRLDTGNWLQPSQDAAGRPQVIWLGRYSSVTFQASLESRSKYSTMLSLE